MPNQLPSLSASNAAHSYGASLSLAPLPSGTAAPVFTELLEIRDIVPPTIKVGVGNTTHLKSPGAWKEKLAGFKDGTQSTFKGNWIDAQSASLIGTLRTKYVWLVKLPLQATQTVNATVEFVGFIENYKIAEPNSDSDEPVLSEVTIEVDGPVYYTQGS